MIKNKIRRCIIYTEGTERLAVAREGDFLIFSMQCHCCPRFRFLCKIPVNDKKFDIEEFCVPTPRAKEIMDFVREYICFLQIAYEQGTI